MYIEDVIYGNIFIPNAVEKILSTPQMQRLKNVQQLGFLGMIIPNAKITRYQHCIGTYYATCKMLASLKRNSKNGDVPQFLLEAVKIAALLHDVGHGPFSHTWEGVAPGFEHEMNALPCIDAIFQSLGEECLPELRANDNYGVKLVKAIIIGNPNFLVDHPLEDHYGYIFEIVNNIRCKLDTDKWDYLKRDHHYLKHVCDPDINFDDVFMKARVSEDGKHIEYRYEDYKRIYAIFEARWKFHIYCYRIPKAMACDALLKDIVSRLQPKISGKNLTEINAFDMAAFLKLTDDNVLQLINNDAKYKYLKNPEGLKKVDKNCYPGNPELLLAVETNIKGPGEVMPFDERFSFYGDPNNKPLLIRNIKNSLCKYFFILTEE